MADIPRPPALTPQFCFSSGALRDFLRTSRSAVDDSITQNLNALVTPSRTAFDPSSTSHRTPTSLSRQLSPQVADTFKQRVLFPSWQARKDVLFYCSVVAASPDPDDPEATLRQIENARDHQRVVDERLDPYSGRFFPREARTEALASLLRQENSVENIVRHRTWGIVQQRCGATGETWEQAVDKWKQSRPKE